VPRHVELFMNGASLRGAAPRVWISGVQEDVPALDVTTAIYPAWDGERSVAAVRRSLRLTIVAQIHEVYNLAARSAALDAIAAWVGSGGVLTASYRPGKRLRVVPTARPSLGAVRDYTQEVKIELTAYAVPYWEDDAVTTRTFGPGSSGNVAFPLGCTHETPLDAVITANGNVTSLSLTAVGQTLHLTGLSLAAGDTLTIEHTEDDYLVIRAGETRLMDKLTADSADDLLLRPGSNTISVSADASISARLTARGRWE